jgi:hypothetical protein
VLLRWCGGARGPLLAARGGSVFYLLLLFSAAKPGKQTLILQTSKIEVDMQRYINDEMRFLNISVPILHLLTQFFWRTSPVLATSSTVSRYDLLPACKIHHRFQENTLSVEGIVLKSENKRIVAIGDVHGSNAGLLADLFAANITQSADVCEWKSQSPYGTILVQVGDIVDRGPHATEAFNCLRHLQAAASDHNSKVIRLIGSMCWNITSYTSNFKKRLLQI